MRRRQAGRFRQRNRQGKQVRQRRRLLVASILSTVLLSGAVASTSSEESPVAVMAKNWNHSAVDKSRDYHTAWRKLIRTPKPTPRATAAPLRSVTPSPTTSPTSSPRRSAPAKPSTKPPEPAPAPTTEAPKTPSTSPTSPPTYEAYEGPFPTKESTGPRVALSALKASGAIVSSKPGQVIEKLDVSSGIKIIHDNVTVRDVRLKFSGGDGSYGLHVAKTNDGRCPKNVVLEYVEVSGTSQLSDETIAVYSPCPYTLRHSRIFDVGSAVRITNGTVIEDNFIHANLTRPGSDAHRSAIGLNGGRDHRIVGNTVDCEGKGCSGALVMYGDFNPVENVLVQSNLFATTGSYCTYAGSLESKKYPTGTNVRYIDNHFSRKYHDTCGKYGPVSGKSSGHGNVWEGNVWDDTGKPV